MTILINQKQMFTRKGFAKGFTLVELMVVVTVVGILAGVGIAAVNTQYQRERAEDTVRATQVENLGMAVESYFASEGTYPDDDGNTPDLDDKVLQKFVAEWPVGVIYQLAGDGSDFAAYTLQSDTNYTKYRSSSGTVDGCTSVDIEDVTVCHKTDTYVPTFELMAIEISPDDSSLEIGGGGIQLTAYEIYSNNDRIQISEGVLWSVLSGSSFVNVNSTGFVTPQSVGTAQVGASYEAESGTFTATADIKVVQPPPELQSLAVVAVTSTDIEIGEIAEFRATATYTDSSTEVVTTNSNTTWSVVMGGSYVDNLGDAAPLNKGRFKGIAEGTATVRANFFGYTDDGIVTVSVVTEPPPADCTLASVTINPSSTSIAINSSKNLTAQASYSDCVSKDITFDPDTVWAEASGQSLINLVANSSQVYVKGVMFGNASVTAKYGGKTGVSNITVTITPSGDTCTVDGECTKRVQEA